MAKPRGAGRRSPSVICGRKIDVGRTGLTRTRALLAAALLLCSTALANDLTDLFQKAKAQVRGENWSGALESLDRLDVEAARPGNEAARDQLAAPTAFYRAVCEANLDLADKAREDFATFLRLQPNASIDPSMYSKKAIAAFQAARKNAAIPTAESENRSSLFTAFQEFRLPPNASEQVNDLWDDGPISWIMTPEEKRNWDLLTEGAEQQEFVERFWE